jgi:outer membrane protein TolC
VLAVLTEAGVDAESALLGAPPSARGAEGGGTDTVHGGSATARLQSRLLAIPLADALDQLLAETGTPAGADRHAWAAASPGARPEYQAQEAAVARRRAARRAEQWRYAPTVALTGYVAGQGFDQRFGRAVDPAAWFARSYVALSVSVPVLDGGARAARVAQGRLREAQGRTALDSLARTIAYERDSARARTAEAEAALDLQREAESLARETLRIARVRERAGRGTPDDTAAAIEALSQAELAVAEAIHDVLVARLDERRAAGAVDPGRPGVGRP